MTCPQSRMLSSILHPLLAAVMAASFASLGFGMTSQKWREAIAGTRMAFVRVQALHSASVVSFSRIKFRSHPRVRFLGLPRQNLYTGGLKQQECILSQF